MSLQKALLSAKANARTRKLQPTQGRAVLVRRETARVAAQGRAVPRGTVQRVAVQRAAIQRTVKSTPQLRADTGKRVKVVATDSRKAAARPAGKVKVAAR